MTVASSAGSICRIDCEETFVVWTHLYTIQEVKSGSAKWETEVTARNMHVSGLHKVFSFAYDATMSLYNIVDYTQTSLLYSTIVE